MSVVDITMYFSVLGSRGKIRDWGFLRNAGSKQNPARLNEDATTASIFIHRCFCCNCVYVIYVYWKMLSSVKCFTPNNKVCGENIVGAKKLWNLTNRILPK